MSDPTVVLDQLESFVRQKFDVAQDDPDFNRDVHLFDYGYVDSFGAVEMTLYSEQKYGIRVTNDDLVMNPLNTIREISAFIHQRVNRRG